jgi:hypothetical protein
VVAVRAGLAAVAGVVVARRADWHAALTA